MDKPLSSKFPGLDSQSAFVMSLQRYFRKRVPHQEVDDHVQDVLLSLQGRQHEEDIEDIQRYAFVVARNLLRKKARDRMFDINASPERWETETNITPERIAISRDRLSRTKEAIGNLPLRTRQVFTLHRFEEMTYQSIANGLGISISAVEKHIIAALKALRNALDGE